MNNRFKRAFLRQHLETGRCQAKAVSCRFHDGLFAPPYPKE
jgi:hypothetical protein